MINIVMSELSSTHVKNPNNAELQPESVAWIVWKVWPLLDQYNDNYFIESLVGI
jgi:hypothetical protein